jgi:hypothetical protein
MSALRFALADMMVITCGAGAGALALLAPGASLQAAGVVLFACASRSAADLSQPQSRMQPMMAKITTKNKTAAPPAMTPTIRRGSLVSTLDRRPGAAVVILCALLLFLLFLSCDTCFRSNARKKRRDEILLAKKRFR